MRLINTSTFQQQQLYDIGEPVSYAILSHRWLSKNELTFKDYSASLLLSTESSPAISKIRGACRAAKQRGLDWIWIDNVCIDKSSSSELSEAINSMFNWYRQAALCIAYLGDTTGSVRRKDGKGSEWFERGWTLQELLAPKAMEFFDRDWRPFGTRGELAREIESVSRIEACFLDGRRHFRTASIAKRLSWQSTRTTTREEDLSYSMLGILNVSLDARYGEGGLAFMRLQGELMKNQTVTDESLFAWTAPANIPLPQHDRPLWEADEWGLLAPSPAYFFHSIDITAGKQFRPRQDGNIIRTGDGVVFPMTYKELQSTSRMLAPLHFIVPFSPVLINHIVHKRRKEFVISLNCWRVDEKGKERPVQVALVRDQKGDQYWRRCKTEMLGLDRKMSTSSYTKMSKSVVVLQPNVLD